MIRNYIKTATRNIWRNKLFSAINILGLAISMSVGLLLIALLFDLGSFDTFHENGDRIYRITNIATFNSERETKFATTSIKTAKLIRDQASGVEEVAVLRNGFSGDAVTDKNIVPVKGFWAEPEIFRIFSFPLLEGNPVTALSAPNSVVLTRTAATKLFGSDTALGQSIRFDSLTYQVTGIMKDVPFFSHIDFEALVSFSTLRQLHKGETGFEAWTNTSSNYVYLLKRENTTLASLQSQLDAIAMEENQAAENTNIQLELLPLSEFVVGENLISMGRIGPHVSPMILWILAALCIVVLLSACLNYSILTMARAMRRYKEIGLRKTLGAGRGQVRQQFLVEAILISVLSLLISYPIFLLLRPQLFSMAPELQQTFVLELSFPMLLAFVLFSLMVGVVAGFLPALFFSRVSAMDALRTNARVKVLGNLPLRRALVVIQYTLTLIFMTSTAIGYVQYRDILAFDLGFNTENILNIDMQNNDPTTFINELKTLPEVNMVSRSSLITSIGQYWGGSMKYKDAGDSAVVMTNRVDENYFPLHGHEFAAGGNFIERPSSSEALGEVIVNQEVLDRFNIANRDPEAAIGEEVALNGKSVSIVGVLKDIHYGKAENTTLPVAFTSWTPSAPAFVNVKINGANLAGTMEKITSVWKGIDPVHPLKADFYEESIQQAYSEFSAMVKIIGFLSFLAITIASMGLFGMVAFSLETRMKEVSIRKVLGANTLTLVFMLSRGFVGLLGISALIALPVTYFLFESYLLLAFPYHSPVGLPEMLAGLMAVLTIAFILIGSQALKAARGRPVEVLKNN